MLDDLIELVIDIVVKDVGNLKAKRKLQKLQEEGVDRYIWLVRGIDIGSYPYSDQVHGLEKCLISVWDYKAKDESPQQYIDSFVQKAKIIQDGRNIIVKKRSIELNFEIKEEKMFEEYERFTFPDSKKKKKNIKTVAGNVEVRYHGLDLMYKGWSLKTNLLVGTDQFLQKPFRIRFLDEEPLQ